MRLVPMLYCQGKRKTFHLKTSINLFNNLFSFLLKHFTFVLNLFHYFAKNKRLEILTESVPWLNTDCFLDLSNYGCNKLKPVWILINRSQFKGQVSPQQAHLQHGVTTLLAWRDCDLHPILNIALSCLSKPTTLRCQRHCGHGSQSRRTFLLRKDNLVVKLHQSESAEQAWISVKDKRVWILLPISTTHSESSELKYWHNCKTSSHRWYDPVEATWGFSSEILAIIKILRGQIFIAGYFSQTFLHRVEKMFFFFSVTGVQSMNFYFCWLISR